MASSLAIQLLSLPPSTDLKTSQYCAVDCNTSGLAALPTAGGAIVGVLQNDDSDTTTNMPCAIAFDGVTQWKLGGTVAKGDVVKVDSSGSRGHRARRRHRGGLGGRSLLSRAATSTTSASSRSARSAWRTRTWRATRPSRAARSRSTRTRPTCP
jgi:hypothetical protein